MALNVRRTFLHVTVNGESPKDLENSVHLHRMDHPHEYSCHQQLRVAPAMKNGLYILGDLRTKSRDCDRMIF